MQKFTFLSAVPAPLPLMNVDTDMIIPKQFLKTIKRTGLGEHLFYEMRYRVDGSRVDDFILHRAPYDKAKILISGANFGCGSSREHAPWALLDFGIRCIIAPSFADIFYNNCFKNGILPIVQPEAIVETLMQQAANGVGQFTIDLLNQTIIDANGTTHTFEVDSFRKHCLLEGLDDIGLTLQHEDKISAYEAAKKQQTPWLWGGVRA